MPIIAYYGENFEQFKQLTGCLNNIINSTLPPPENTDILVIDASPEQPYVIPTGVISVVNSHNTNGLYCLMQSGVKTVTCGMSYRDTVTLSSSVSKPCVCLQRKLPSFCGKIFEPCEYMIKNSCQDTDLLLLACATRLLCGLEPI